MSDSEPKPCRLCECGMWIPVGDKNHGFEPAKNELTLKELVKQSHELAKEKGWWPNFDDPESDEPNIPEKLALIHSEISEALEEYRAGRGLVTGWVGESSKPNGFGIELADAMIRIADLVGYLGIDLEVCIREKHKYNKTREYRHGGKAC